MLTKWVAAALLALAATGPAVMAQPATQVVAAADYAADTAALDQLLAANYAYLDRFPDGRLPVTPQLDALRAAVRDSDTLLAYAELRLHTLADHHASTGSSFADSWALVPTFSDLWIERQGNAYIVTAVREASLAANAGILPGDQLVAVGDMSADAAIAAFWAPTGISGDDEALGYAARVVAAGRRDRPRDLSLSRNGVSRRYRLANLYDHAVPSQPVTVTSHQGSFTIRINNALGDNATIAAFDAAMAALPRDAAVEIDLTDTPSGGNTTVARGIMGWFVDRATAYQLHNWPAEFRASGVERQWIEQVLPRGNGRFHRGPVSVRVGRWTGSMGEGLAVGFHAIGARVHGEPMAGLLGAIYNFTLPRSGLRVTFPAERLLTVDGVPRELFRPERQ